MFKNRLILIFISLIYCLLPSPAIGMAKTLQQHLPKVLQQPLQRPDVVIDHWLDTFDNRILPFKIYCLIFAGSVGIGALCWSHARTLQALGEHNFARNIERNNRSLISQTNLEAGYKIVLSQMFAKSKIQNGNPIPNFGRDVNKVIVNHLMIDNHAQREHLAAKVKNQLELASNERYYDQLLENAWVVPLQTLGFLCFIGNIKRIIKNTNTFFIKPTTDIVIALSQNNPREALEVLRIAVVTYLVCSSSILRLIFGR